jgi:predicted HicB family RNase H-like nuclease
MARPKLPNGTKKEKLNLSVSPETKEMLILMRNKMDISISEFVEEAIHREYRKMVKKGTITDVPGQMSLDDFQ